MCPDEPSFNNKLEIAEGGGGGGASLKTVFVSVCANLQQN